MSIVMVVLKGIGSVILLSFFLWLGFMFIYTPPGMNSYSSPILQFLAICFQISNFKAIEFVDNKNDVPIISLI